MMYLTKNSPLKVFLSAIVAKALKENFHSDLLGEVNEDHLASEFIIPPQKGMGDLGHGLFLWSKKLKKSPAEISTTLENTINQKKYPQLEFAKAAGPYINFSLSASYLAQQMLDRSLIEDFNSQLSGNSEKVMIEYSQPNTHKELHVGHMRNLCLGNALVRIFKYAGVNTLSCTFPGDVGTHVAKTLWYLKKFNPQYDDNGENEAKLSRGAFLGQIYTKAHLLLEEQRNTPAEESNRQELTQILKELHQGSGFYYDLWQTTRLWSIQQMEQLYQWADVKFDRWFFESEVDAPSLKLAHQYYDQGLFVKDQGAIGIDLSNYKLGFALLIKSDGNGLYATKDLELARKKFQEFKVDRSIYIVDKRQEQHFAQVFKILELMEFKEAKKCFHLSYEFVELPDGPMSSRKGNIVPIEKLINQMNYHIKTQFLTKYDSVLPESEIDELAHTIASGAIKFGMNVVDTHKKIVFDLKEWLSLEGESGPYIQYVYARIQSILRKANFSQLNDDKNKLSSEHFSLLCHPIEKELMILLGEFPQVVFKITENYKTSTLCHYLYQLSRTFNSFYVECPILKEGPALQIARLNLCSIVAEYLKQGLSLLGIQVPDKM